MLMQSLQSAKLQRQKNKTKRNIFGCSFFNAECRIAGRRGRRPLQIRNYKITPQGTYSVLCGVRILILNLFYNSLNLLSEGLRHAEEAEVCRVSAVDRAGVEGLAVKDG